MIATVLFFLASAHAAAPIPRVVCETTVAVGDGELHIDLWQDVAPNGVKRLIELVDDGFFTNLPFFRAIPNFLIQFGISTDVEKQAKWERAGNIKDDPHPSPGSLPFTDGIVSYAGYGANSRSTHLFLTLGTQSGLGRSPWEVPVGKVTKGLDVMHAIYTGYGDGVNQGMLNPRDPHAKEYLEKFPKLDRFKSCKMVRDEIVEHAENVEL